MRFREPFRTQLRNSSTAMRVRKGREEEGKRKGRSLVQVPTNPKEADARGQLDLAYEIRHAYCAVCHPDPLPRMRAICGTIWDRPSVEPTFTPPPNACVVCLDLHTARLSGAWHCPGCGR